MEKSDGGRPRGIRRLDDTGSKNGTAAPWNY